MSPLRWNRGPTSPHHSSEGGFSRSDGVPTDVSSLTELSLGGKLTPTLPGRDRKKNAQNDSHTKDIWHEDVFSLSPCDEACQHVMNTAVNEKQMYNQSVYAPKGKGKQEGHNAPPHSSIIESRHTDIQNLTDGEGANYQADADIEDYGWGLFCSGTDSAASSLTEDSLLVPCSRRTSKASSAVTNESVDSANSQLNTNKNFDNTDNANTDYLTRKSMQQRGRSGTRWRYSEGDTEYLRQVFEILVSTEEVCPHPDDSLVLHQHDSKKMIQPKGDFAVPKGETSRTTDEARQLNMPHAAPLYVGGKSTAPMMEEDVQSVVSELRGYDSAPDQSSKSAQLTTPEYPSLTREVVQKEQLLNKPFESILVPSFSPINDHYHAEELSSVPILVEGGDGSGGALQGKDVCDEEVFDLEM